MSDHNAGAAPDDPAAAQRTLNEFAAGRGLITDRLIEQLQAEYAPAAEEKPVQSVPLYPGDVVMSATTRYVWWVHDHRNFGLSLTGLRGRCLPVPEAVAMYGELSVLFRLTDPVPDSPPAHQ